MDILKLMPQFETEIKFRPSGFTLKMIGQVLEYRKVNKKMILLVPTEKRRQEIIAYMKKNKMPNISKYIISSDMDKDV